MTSPLLTYLAKFPYPYYTWGLALAILLASVAARTDAFQSSSVYVFYFSSTTLWSVLYMTSNAFKSKAFTVGSVLLTLLWISFVTFSPIFPHQYRAIILGTLSIFANTLATFLMLYLRWKNSLPAKEANASEMEA